MTGLSPRWRWGAAAAAVALIGLASGVAMFAGARKARDRALEPERFARRAAASLGRELALDAGQKAAVQEILRRQRAELNEIGREELALWPVLLDTSDQEALKTLGALDALAARRNARRWAAVQEVKKVLTPDQRKLYGTYSAAQLKKTSRLLAGDQKQ